MGYLLNGIDIDETYQTIFENGVSEFLKLPDRKASQQNDFADKNGIDIDLSKPKFSARTFNFNAVTSGATVEEMQNNYFGLFTEIKMADTYTLYNDQLDRTIKIFYQKQGNLSDIYRNSEGGYSVKHTLTFGERDSESTGNIPNIYLVTTDGKFLVP